jgi:outer membrane protein assembly factor BamB
MNATRTLVAVALALATLPASFAAEPAKIPDAGITETPTGAYQIARITLIKGTDKGQDVPAILNLREGKLVNAWFLVQPVTVSGDPCPDSYTVQIKDGVIQGTILGRASFGWPDQSFVGFSVALDGKVTGRILTGTFTTTFRDKKWTGNFQGTIEDEAQLAKSNALTPGKNWPWWYGAGSARRGPDCGAKMIDSLGDARPVWKSEEPVPSMWGKGHSGDQRAMARPLNGGASSPVVAEGMVYQFFFRPTGAYPEEAKRKDEAAKLTTCVAAQRGYVDGVRPLADSIVVALDAATGKIVWKTTFPERSKNVQMHKIRDFNPTPYVSDGIVYVVDYAKYLYALDAKTGKLIWERPGKKGSLAANNAGQGDNTGPAVAEGTVLFNGSVGLDAKTGKELWKGPGGLVLKWNHAGREYFIVQGNNVSCLDPKTGKALWSEKSPAGGGKFSQQNIIDGDYFVGLVGTSQVVCSRLSEQGMQKVWAVAAPPNVTDTLSLTIANKHVYVDGDAETFCLKIESGEKVGTAKAGGARSQLMFAADDRVFILTEQRHGGQQYYMLAGDPKTFRVLGDKLWTPPHLTDSSYDVQSNMTLVVDGRLFVRGHDGIYCYDLRKAAGASDVPAVEPKTK